MHNWDSTFKIIRGIRGDGEEKSKDTSTFVSQASICLYLGMYPCEDTEQVVECGNNNCCFGVEKRGLKKVSFLVQGRLVDKLGKKCGKDLITYSPPSNYDADEK